MEAAAERKGAGSLSRTSALPEMVNRVRDHYISATAWRVSVPEGRSDLARLQETLRAEFDRALNMVRAEAWDEGALFAAVECDAIAHDGQPWIAPGDNPYRAQ